MTSERVFVLSDGSRYPSGGAPKNLSEASPSTHDPARPEAAHAAFRVLGGQTMPTGTGRPTALESQRRQHEFLRLLADGHTWRDAARQVGFKGDTVLTMLDKPEFRTVVAALLDGRAEVAAVTVAPATEKLAA